MFWHLYLAHLIGDYPLQPNWMVKIKHTWYGLLLHVGVHLAVLLVIVGAARRVLWPYLLALTFVHFGIDLLKNGFTKYQPQWVAGPYLFDQLLHLSSVLLVASWINQAIAADELLESGRWLVYTGGYLIATYAWFITERVLVHADEGYRRELVAQLWPRMLARAAMVTAWLWGWQLLVIGMAPLIGMNIQLPYKSATYRRQMLVIDIGVALAAAILIRWAR